MKAGGSLVIQFILIAVLELLFGTAARADIRQVTVSASGNDKNDGSAERPFATLERARDALRGAAGGVVVIHGGTYVLEHPLEIMPQDSGTQDNPVKYTAAQGEQVVITSARRIAGWKQYDSHIWVADVAKGWRFHFLYVNGRQTTRSRSVHNDGWRSWGRGFSFDPPTAAGQRVTFNDKRLLKNLPSNGDVEMLCIIYQFGVMGNGVMTDFDPASGTALWHSKQLNLHGARGGSETNFRLENALAFIAQPGEWAVDSAAGKVYYWPHPDEDLTRATVTAPTLNELVRLQGDDESKQYVHNVVFDGLAFSCTDRLPEDQWPDDWTVREWENPDAMIFAEGVEDCAVRNCKLYYSGSYGVTLYRHALRCEIIGNEVGWTGSGGVQLFGFGAGFRDENHDNIVRRNYIHDHGYANYWHSPNIQIFGSGNNWIDHNFLAMSAYNNISITGVPWTSLNNWQGVQSGRSAMITDNTTDFAVDFSTYPPEILAQVKAGKAYFTHDNFCDLAIHSRNNKVFRNVAVECHGRLEEGGALYSWFPGKGNQYVENVIYKSHGLPGSSIISLDNGSEYFTVTGNVVWCNGRAGCGTIGVRPTERADHFIGNIRAFDQYGDAAHCASDAGRDKFDELYQVIKREADKCGGWPGNPDIDAWIKKLAESKERYELSPDEIKKMNRVM